MGNEASILALAEPETLSSSEALSRAASIALTFELGVNWVGEVEPDSLAGEDSRVKAIVIFWCRMWWIIVSFNHTTCWNIVCRNNSSLLRHENVKEVGVTTERVKDAILRDRTLAARATRIPLHYFVIAHPHGAPKMVLVVVSFS